MPTPITINVTNNSPTLQNFFFFQKPAIYVGGQEVYSNSLYTAPLLPHATSGATLTFSLLLQFYAGVQQQVSPPVVGQSSGQLSAIQPIGLTPAAGGTPTNNTTNMTLTPSLGLSPAITTVGPEVGSFRIVTPTFNPVVDLYNAGSAIQSLTGEVTLSNFVTCPPTSNLDCQPILQFYVQTGNFTPGTVMNFTASSINAALCDATPGYSTFNVTYNADGTWTVAPFALVQTSDKGPQLLPGSVAQNAAIKNEAGRAVICTGYAANFNVPVTVQNLSNPDVIQLHKEYQVGPTGGPFTGRMCTSIAGTTAVFS
jgi:hypothetical protein